MNQQIEKNDTRSSPGATYRLQFNAQFTFQDATAILSYLRELGITDLYASPIFRSGAESTHGYDVCSYREFDPKLGGSPGFDALVAKMRSVGLELLLDIVPNHMRADTSNAWWLDVLEKGPASPYAFWFDIDWNSDLPNVHRKVLLPVLGDLYADVLEKGQIQIAFSEEALWVVYFSNRFPASQATYLELLQQTCHVLRFGKSEHPECLPVQELLDTCGGPKTEEKIQKLKAGAWELYCSPSPISEAIKRSLELLNGIPGSPRSFDRLDRILQNQHYRLSWWRTGPEQIDYRRFFDITDLVCLNIQRPEVFEATHQLVGDLIRRGVVKGLRVDHPDGLWDPQQYFSQLLTLWPRQSLAFVVAEKILSGHEHLPRSWPVAGTTGYDFLNQVNGLLVEEKNKEAITNVYKAFTDKKKNFQRLLFDSRLKVLKLSFSGQFESLVGRLSNVAAQTRYGRDFTLKSLRSALSLFIATFPVYRTYVTEESQTLSLQDRRAIERAYRGSLRRAPAPDLLALGFLRQILILEFPQDFDEDARTQAVRFGMELQQLTAPLAAKGQEDTACYIFNRLTSLNEVGGDPGTFGISVEDFHTANERRARHWPHGLLATSTHDTKRGEDVRARINVLSESPERWAAALGRWKEMNSRAKTVLNGNPTPYPNDEYFLYQTLVGTWSEHSLNSVSGMETYRARITQYLLKSVREAKEYTSWTDQNIEYENAVENFVGELLASESRFLSDLNTFTQPIAFFGHLNSLSQTLLKTFSPGAPDFYQGTELWDFSLVDPDNRRPVEFQARMDLLAKLKERSAGLPRSELLSELLGELSSGAIKLFVTWQMLQLRRARSSLFEGGRYLPAVVSGPAAAHLCAFARSRGPDSVIAVAPRLMFQLMGGEPILPIGEGPWSDTLLTLPGSQVGNRFRELFSGREFTPERQDNGMVTFKAGDLLAEFPIALLSSIP